MKVKLTVDASSLATLDLSGVIDNITARVEKAFSNDIGPHYVEVAKKRAPVSQEKNFNPQRSSFQRLRLKSPGSLSGSAGDRLVDLHGLASKPRRSKGGALLRSRDGEEIASGLPALTSRFRAASGGRSEDPNITQFFEVAGGPSKGQTPDAVAILGGTIKGAVRHRPGTLRDSIHVESVTRQGNQVVLRVVADAPYAAAISNGFTHKGGRDKSGKQTKIAPDEFMRSPMTNVRDRLQNPNTYR